MGTVLQNGQGLWSVCVPCIRQRQVKNGIGVSLQRMVGYVSAIWLWARNKATKGTNTWSWFILVQLLLMADILHQLSLVVEPTILRLLMFYSYFPTSTGCHPEIVVPHVDLYASHTWQHVPPQTQAPGHKLAAKNIKHHQRPNPELENSWHPQKANMKPQTWKVGRYCPFSVVMFFLLRFHLKFQGSQYRKYPCSQACLLQSPDRRMVAMRCAVGQAFGASTVGAHGAVARFIGTFDPGCLSPPKIKGENLKITEN